MSIYSAVQIHVVKGSVTTFVSTAEYIRGHPYMTSALRGEGGVSPKEDVVREVA